MIYALWTVLLLILALMLPILAFALQRLWRSARNVQRYFREMEAAGRGIAQNTAAVARLDDTIEVAGQILSTAGSIDSGAQTLHSVLAERSRKTSPGGRHAQS